MAQTFIQSENFRCFIGQQSCLSGADVKDEILRNWPSERNVVGMNRLNTLNYVEFYELPSPQLKILHSFTNILSPAVISLNVTSAN